MYTYTYMNMHIYYIYIYQQRAACGGMTRHEWRSRQDRWDDLRPLGVVCTLGAVASPCEYGTHKTLNARFWPLLSWGVPGNV